MHDPAKVVLDLRGRVEDPEVPARVPRPVRLDLRRPSLLCRRFFRWYNHEHRHSGIGLPTPADVHFDRADAVRAARAEVLTDAYGAHPERFVRKHPEPPTLAGAVWINKPDPTNSTNP